ncbi:MAG: hypothetical protein IPL63_18070 [Saprospiraceae bacterium]|nr:hypothetical protein [Saprospiraceae bacterium]
MKHLVIFCFLALFSCSQPKNKFQDCIEKYLSDIAMGVKLENDFKEITLVKDVPSKELLTDLYQTFEFDTIIPVDSVLYKLDNSLSISEPIWQIRRDRLYEVSQLKNNEIAYSIVHATHEFKNPLINNAIVEVKRTYIIDKDCNVMGSIDDSEMTSVEKEYSKTPYLKYEYAIMVKRNN